ncbi:hypothetical protein R2083_07295 [Nitrosomonas sp. Is35]|uniref:hypothetical protein n=1 Tax=Nitrosomonas sp. Is35 TaxID=3080534 RepID=UPI00294B4AA1|nr:hypothetical protein [Nitrosomonas sp. Is35]MDV6347318.1 hypothetical protein [Nitrosomonas sp. Is35]
MRNQEINNDEVVIVRYPEKIPGNPESYRKMANEFEDASSALASLGELMRVVDRDRLEEYTIQGIGSLLEILGKHLMNNSFEAMDMASESQKQQELNQSPDLSRSVEANQSRV